MIKCIFNHLKLEITTETELTNLINKAADNDFNEICVYRKDKTALTILTNKVENKAFLMFQDLKKEKYYIPINQNNSSDIYVDFLLSNGQMDEYPTNSLVDFESAKSSILEYYNNEQMWSGINWVEE